MARRKIHRPDLELYQRALAQMIDRALTRGQRGDGTNENHWTPWTLRGFADASHAAFSEGAVANWRDPDKMMPPDDIKPLLKLFYGTADRFKSERVQMERLWRLARGYIVEDADAAKETTIEPQHNLQGVARLVRLHAHSPVPWNDGTMRFSITLVITPDRDLSYRGRAVTIGLTEALLCMDAPGWQPAWQSWPSQRGLEHFVAEAAGDRITGPRDPCTAMINGAPLGNEYLAVFEQVGTGDGPITVAVHAPRGSFRVLPESKGNQNVVLNALFHEQLRDRDDHDRAILARQSIGPRAGNADHD